ncbi:MAG TPA: hypothetical protein VKQ72_19320 [Aggregatilineales bacterium]|nr:hypothetical protein [Aggregatilineales bacterium]
MSTRTISATNEESSAGTPTARPTNLGPALIMHEAFPSLSYGIQAFLWWNGTTRERDLEHIRQLRFNYVKQIFGWNDVRASKDVPYDWSRADLIVAEAKYRGIKVIARLGQAPYWAVRPSSSDPTEPPYDEQAFGEYCHDIATRYKGQIAGYQVWNEPNLSREWGGRPPNPAAYVKFLAPCYQAIKAADPDAVVISAPLAPTGTDAADVMTDQRYLEGMFAAGLSSYYDALGLNAPGYKWAPETSPDDPSLTGSRFFVFRHVEDMRAIQVAHGDGARQIAILEVGWTTDVRDQIKDAQGNLIPNPYRWHAVTEGQQSDYLVAAYAYAAEHWRPWVGLMTTIYLADPKWTPDDEEYWWSISLPGMNNAVRGAFINLANAPRYIDATVIPSIGAGDNPYVPMPPMPTFTPSAP